MRVLETKIGTKTLDFRVPGQMYAGNDDLQETDVVLIMEVSEDTFTFLNNVAIVENEGYSKKLYKVNGIEFREIEQSKEDIKL